MNFVYFIVISLLMFVSCGSASIVDDGREQKEKEKEEETWHGNWNWNIDLRYSDADSCPYSPPSGVNYSDGAGDEGGGNGYEGGAYGGHDSKVSIDSGYESDPD